MKVLILLHHKFELWNAPEWFPQKLQHDFPDLRIVHLSSYRNAEHELPDAEIIIAWSLRPEQFAIARKLRWIHSPAAAVHQLMFPELINSVVILTNAREVHAPVVAEHVIAVALALAKKIPAAVRLQDKHVWGKDLMWTEGPRPRELMDSTLALIGLGSIGREVARRASAVGMRVIATRKHADSAEPVAGVERVFPTSELNHVLSQADFAVIAVPRTPATERLIDRERISRMKRDAYLINVSRGALVDEAALCDALQQGKIAGAALDVFSEEPLPQDSPLWNLKNLLITPHTAAITEKLWERHYELVSDNVRRYLTGQPLRAVVNKQEGY